MKTILITGCSHSSGVEFFDKLMFEDYASALKKGKNLSLYEIYVMRQRSSIKYLLDNHSNKHFKKILMSDTKKAGDIAQRYFTRKEKNMAWPAVMQKELTNYRVVNLANGGNSFKLNIKNSLDYIRSSNQVSHCVYQVPTYTRTYIKHKGAAESIVNMEALDLQIKSHEGDFENSGKLKRLKELYKNLVKRDIDSGYFEKATVRHVNLIEKRIKKDIKVFYILENNELEHLFPKEKVIMNNFAKFRSQYQTGLTNHVIDPKFSNDMSNHVASQIGLK